VAYKLDGIAEIRKSWCRIPTWQTDTVTVSPDSVMVVKSIKQIGTRKESKEVFAWDKGYVEDYTGKVNILMDNVMKQGAKVYAAAGGAGGEKLESFKRL
jgi:hypothetical protein